MAKKDYGNAWWGKTLLNALKNADEAPRPPKKGRQNAGSGRVTLWEVKKGQAYAEMEGQDGNIFRVHLTLQAFDNKERQQLLRLLEQQPLLLEQALDRQVSPELEELCQAQHFSLFPKTWVTLSAHDAETPPSFVATAIYMLADELDKKPFLLFELRGFDLVKALQERGTRLKLRELPIRKISSLVSDALLPERGPSFHFDEEAAKKVGFNQLKPGQSDKLLRILPDKPTFYQHSGNARDMLRQGYAWAAHKAGLPPDNSKVHSIPPDAIEWLFILKDMTGNFVMAEAIVAGGLTGYTWNDPLSFRDWLMNIDPVLINRCAPVLRGLHLCADFARRLVRCGAIVPEMLEVDLKTYQIRWVPAETDSDTRAVSERMKALTPDMALCYQDAGRLRILPTREDAKKALLAFFIDTWMSDAELALGPISFDPSGIEALMQADQDKYQALFFGGGPVPFFSLSEKYVPGEIRRWLSPLSLREKAFLPCLIIEDFPEEGEFEVSLSVEAQQAPDDVPMQLSDWLGEKMYAAQRDELLNDLDLLIKQYPDLQSLVDNGGDGALVYDIDAFPKVLFDVLPLTKLFGINVLMPKYLQNIIRPKSCLVAKGRRADMAQLSIAQLPQLLHFEWGVKLGEEVLSIKEFQQEFAQQRGLAYLDPNYLYLSDADMQAITEQIGKAPQLSAFEMLQGLISEEVKGQSVVLDDDAKALVAELRRRRTPEAPSGLGKELRGYQHRAFEWLHKNAQLGMGCILADDMGLGKSVELIALLLKMKEEGRLGGKKILLVAPENIIINWRKELASTAPSLSILPYYGPQRQLDGLGEHDVVLASYDSLVADAKSLAQAAPWAIMVADEAEQISQAQSEKTQAAKQVQAGLKIALSNMPLEQRLADYWSLFDFVNPGYMGSQEDFESQVVGPIERERDGQALRRFLIISTPMLLRRGKGDKSVLKDLPTKIDQDYFCQLSSWQADLYQNVLADMMDKVKTSEDTPTREALVLKLATALKQVCNHPVHYLKQGLATPEASGKSIMLLDLLHNIVHNMDEKVILFVQYREMGEMLSQMIWEHLRLEAPFMHGGLKRAMRDEMVAAFQKQRHKKILLLSVKAGGTGVNLTAAKHVIHYDLWWNPNVESHATDRAYLVGSTKHLHVHRFVTPNTVEEHVNDMLHSKSNLEALSIGTGEKWLADLSDDDLLSLLTPKPAQ